MFKQLVFNCIFGVCVLGFSAAAAADLVDFTGGDAGEGLDLTGDIIYAFNLGGPTLTVQGVTFVGADRTAPPAGITSTGLVTNQFDYASVNTGGVNGADYGATPDDDALEAITNTVWYDENWSFDLAVTPGNQYQLQLIFQEGYFNFQGTDVRNFDVSVEGGGLVVDDLVLGMVTDGAAPIQPGADYGKVFQYTFTAADSSFRVSLDDSPNGTDVNSILGGVTLEAVSAVPEPTSLAVLGLGGVAMLFRRRRI